MRALALLCLAGCATTTELRVHDPHAVRIETVRGRPIALPPKERAESSCTWRDDSGFPHFCFAGRIHIAEDGTITVGGTPDIVGNEMRIEFDTLRWGWCRRPLRWCLRSSGKLVLVTPIANVARWSEP